MTFRLEQTSFPQLLCGCFTQRLNGTLILTYNSVTKTVYFEDGLTIYASSDIISERFGERLRMSGRITPEQFDQAMQHMKAGGGRQLGGCLIDLGFFRESEMHALLAEQVTGIIYSLFPWREGEYEFKNERVEIQGFKLRMSTAEIIFQGIRYLNDIPLIRRWLGDFNKKIVPTSDPLLLYQTVTFLPEEAYIISRLTGPMSFNELLAVAGMPEEQLLRTVCALKSAGIVESVEGDSLPPLMKISVAESVQTTSLQIDAAAAAQLCFEVSEVVHNIEKGADHYQILGIGRRAGLDEIKKAYRELAKKFHPDRHSQLAGFDIQIKSELERVFIRFQEAYDTLGDEAKRKKYDGVLRMPGTPVPTPPPFPATVKRTPTDNQPVMSPPRSTPTSNPPYSTPKPSPPPLEYVQPRPQPPTGSSPPIQPKPSPPPPLEYVQPRPQPPTGSSPPIQPKPSPPPPLEYVQPRPQPPTGSTPPVSPMSPPSRPTQPVAPYSTPKPFPGPSTNPPSGASQPRPPYSTPPSGNPSVLPPSASASNSSEPAANATPRQFPAQATPQSGGPSKPNSGSYPSYQTPGKAFPSVPPSLGTPNLSASEFYMKCIEFLDKNDIERACQSIRRAVEMRPKNPEYHAQLGRVLIMMQGHNKQAEKEFLIAIDLDPQNPDLPDLMVELSDFYRKFGMTQRANDLVAQVLEKSPDHYDARQRWAEFGPKPDQASGWKKIGSLVGKVFNRSDTSEKP